MRTEGFKCDTCDTFMPDTRYTTEYSPSIHLTYYPTAAFRGKDFCGRWCLSVFLKDNPNIGVRNES